MKETVTLQGRELVPEDIETIRNLISDHPDWSRRRLSIELCHTWDWRNAKGEIKDMASRSLLVKLDERGWIRLPPRRQTPSNRMQRQIHPVAHESTVIEQPLKTLLPLKIVNVAQEPDHKDLFTWLMHHYHYLGYRGSVGENMPYLILDAKDRPLACSLFGSSAWSAKDRDRYIGWNQRTRERNINMITNNTRYLVLPWVRVSNLASHILSRIARRIADDWQARYGHRVIVLETFVEDGRFTGTCYRAANWMTVGKTQGRSRNDRYTRMKVPVKSIFLYPLVADFRKKLQTLHEVAS